MVNRINTVFVAFSGVTLYEVVQGTELLCMDDRGGSRGRVQGVIGVDVEQETSAPPPKKNPGSAPG